MRCRFLYLVPAFLAASAFAQPRYFRDEEVKVVGDLQFGQTSDKIEYANKPPYVALYFDAHAGDKVDIKIASINGQAMAALTDSGYRPIVTNFGSHVTAVLPAGPEPYPNRYFIIMQEERRKPATFIVMLEKTAVNTGVAAEAYLACSVDADCVAVPREGCCHNGLKDAVNKNKIDEYRAANTCKVAHPICPQYIIDDRRVPQCNRTTHQCEMVRPVGPPR